MELQGFEMFDIREGNFPHLSLFGLLVVLL